MIYAEDDVSGRPRLSLQPRGLGGDQSSPSPVPSKTTSKPSPFGAARPREQVIAEREGKNETDVLKEQAQKEWKPSIVLTEAQREEKKAAEAELAFAKSELSKEVDPMKSRALKEEVGMMENKLSELLDNFEKLAVQAAQTGGGGGRRTYERRREEERGPAGAAVPGGDRYIADGGQDGYGNFSRGRDREGFQGGSYGDSWGAKGGVSTRGGGVAGGGGGRLGGSGCYKCGEIGHFSRECPNAGGAGGGRGGYGGGYFAGGASGGGGVRGGSGRPCYTCGQEGHFSRECPQGGGGYGSQQGGYGGQTQGGGYGGDVGATGYDQGSYGASQQGGGSYYSGDGYNDRYMQGGAQGRTRSFSTGRQDGY